MRVLVFLALLPAFAGAADPLAGRVKVIAPEKEEVKTSATSSPAPAREAGKPGFTVTQKHLVENRDTLWDLAAKYYSNPFVWGRIYDANTAKIEKPDLIYPGEELEIPGATEEIKPAAEPAPAAAAPEAGPEEPVIPGAVRAEETAAPARQPLLVAVPDVEKNAAAEAYAGIDLSEEMPEDQKEWSDEVFIVAENWREDGTIAGKEGGDDWEESLGETGDVVLLKLGSGSAVGPGDVLTTYIRGSATVDKRTKKPAKEIARTGAVKVLSVEGGKARARIIRANTSVDSGQLVKKG